MTDREIITAQKEQINILKTQNARLQNQLNQLLKLIYGRKSERFVAEIDDSQLSIFGEAGIKEEEEEPQEEIQYKRKKPRPHPGRNEIPAHLPVEEVVIEPEDPVEGLTRIGEEITETLEYTPASLVCKRVIRPKYAKPDGAGILIGKLPKRPIEKGIAEASLLAHILVSKFVDHLPYYRQIEIFKRDFDWTLPKSTVNDWMAACCTLLWPLYEVLRQEVLSQDYIQADESPIKVLDKQKKGDTHRGYMWAYHAPESGLVYFQYRKGRGKQGPKEALAHYRGYLQCDGYQVYDKVCADKDIVLIGCLAHARRKFFDAQQSDPERSRYALQKFQSIYRIEREIQSGPKDLAVRQTARQQHIHPILVELKEWVAKESIAVLPRSPIAKAIVYYQNQWPKLEGICQDGRFRLDNNLLENAIRPLALGRKNYLFCGSHSGAERNAMIYSFMGSCKIQKINPRLWLQHTLQVIGEHPVNRLRELLPGYASDVMLEV